MDITQLDYQATLLNALSDPNRLYMMQLLQKQPLTVVELREELATFFDLPAANLAVGHHLRILKQARLIRNTKRGAYQSNIQQITEAYGAVFDLLPKEHIA